jgi:hypothetical protein
LEVFEEIVGASPPGGVMPKEGYYLAQVYEKIGQAEMALQVYREFIKGREETGWAENIDAAIARLGGGE